MSRLRVLGVGVLIGAVLLTGAGCAKKREEAKPSDRGPIHFVDPPAGSEKLGLCYAYDIAHVKALIGGDNTFKRLPPTAIGKPNDQVTGEACAWQRTEPNGDARSLRIEVRNFGKGADDMARRDSQFKALEDGAIDAQEVPGLGDGAFSSLTDNASVLQVKSGPYLLTLASRTDGALTPVKVNALQLLAASGLNRLP